MANTSMSINIKNFFKIITPYIKYQIMGTFTSAIDISYPNFDYFNSKQKVLETILLTFIGTFCELSLYV